MLIGTYRVDHNDFLPRFVYLPLAALTGALSSLGSRHWRHMTKRKAAFVLVTGVSFGLFVTPFVAHSWLGVQEDDARAIVAITYLMAFGADIMLPWVLRQIRKLAGSETVE